MNEAVQHANERKPFGKALASNQGIQFPLVDLNTRCEMVHGGMGYSRYKPFEHIYRHHRRYRITEGADEIQMRRAAGYLFGFMKQQKPKGVS